MEEDEVYVVEPYIWVEDGSERRGPRRRREVRLDFPGEMVVAAGMEGWAGRCM